MQRLKTFLKYAIWLILFFIFSQIMIYVALNTSYEYKGIEIHSSLIESAQIKATSIDGTASINVKNNSNTDISHKYIKIDCYSKNNVLMGTKYIEIKDLPINEQREYDVRFNFNKVDNAKIDVIDNLPNIATEEQKLSDKIMSPAMVVGALIVLMFI